MVVYVCSSNSYLDSVFLLRMHTRCQTLKKCTERWSICIKIPTFFKHTDTTYVVYSKFYTNKAYRGHTLVRALHRSYCCTHRKRPHPVTVLMTYPVESGVCSAVTTFGTEISVHRQCTRTSHSRRRHVPRGQLLGRSLERIQVSVGAW